MEPGSSSGAAAGDWTASLASENHVYAYPTYSKRAATARARPPLSPQPHCERLLWWHPSTAAHDPRAECALRRAGAHHRCECKSGTSSSPDLPRSRARLSLAGAQVEIMSDQVCESLRSIFVAPSRNLRHPLRWWLGEGLRSAARSPSAPSAPSGSRPRSHFAPSLASDHRSSALTRVAQAANACSSCAPRPHGAGGCRRTHERRRAASPPTSPSEKAAHALVTPREGPLVVACRGSTLAWPRCPRGRCALHGPHSTGT